MSKEFVPSPQQTDFFEWIVNDDGSCVLEAAAGSGKTSSLIKALTLMNGSIFFGAFNKKIATEIEEKAGKRPGLTVSTMHAAGYSAWRKVAPKVKVDSNKCKDIFFAMTDSDPEFAQYAELTGPVLALVSLAKQSGIGIVCPQWDTTGWQDLIDHYDVDSGDYDDDVVISLAQKVLTKSIEKDKEIVDFDDMIFCPLLHKTNLKKHDWVLIDEAQDTNLTRRMLAVGMMKEGGRLVAVGDAAQAIYGFCGADADALDLIVRDTNAIRLPLTVTYRCPKKVVDVARRYVNHITAHESAPEGSVIELNFDKFAETVKPGDAVLCRLNAPNLRIAYSLISAGVPARIEGREIGTGLKTLVKRWKVTDFDTLRERLDGYREREIAKLRKKNQIARIQAVEDRVECVNTIIDRVIDKGGNPIISVCDEIERIFGAENSNVPIVTLSSIHKAKGREWKRVFWLQTGDARWATKQWMKDQEKNLCYVAATRAMDELYTVDITDFMK